MIVLRHYFDLNGLEMVYSHFLAVVSSLSSYFFPHYFFLIGYLIF